MSVQYQYVIFGSSGFIGWHLQRYLRAQHPEANICCCDIRQDDSGLATQLVDVCNPIELNGSFDSETVIFNLAAIHKTPGHPEKDYFRTNMLGAENVCEFARRHGIATIVFTSSIAPYGAAEEEKTESVLPTPNTPYGISKLVAEKIHQIWQAEAPSRRLSIVRPGIVFGHKEGGNFTRLYKALNKGMFAYAGRKDTRKAAIYVKDLVRVMDQMSKNSKKSMQLYNCCSPIPLTIEEFVLTIQKVTGMRRKIPTIPAAFLKVAASGLDILDSMGLGFHPDRVKKLMISTNILGGKLAADYPLQYTLESALQDWWNECDQQGLW